MTFRTSIGALAVSTLAGAALANPVDGDYFDTPPCDNHGPLRAIEELGTAPLFPTDELISTVSTFTQISACPPMDNPTIPNTLVIMTNLSGRAWDNLFYVADPQTSLTNVDGAGISAAAPGIATHAFRIDSLGVNRNLVGESILPNGIFEPGETWEFIIQDYVNAAGLPGSAMGSLDFAGASAGIMLSSGSVVQFVPSPGTGALLALGCLAAHRRRR